ncbi:MAG: MotA/TolQ/ExbB proton channel family protein [Alphaproteobacteria bacterium]|jgi:hypothetical protein|nr:MotA/TolQ/ExbB proton channel family protein [Alphaproteobacteria bacterium]
MTNTNALLYKWLLTNSFAVLILYVAWLQDWIALVIESDASYLSLAMGVIFLILWAFSSYHILVANREIGRFADGHGEGVAADYFDKLRQKSRNLNGHVVDQAILAGALRVRLMTPIQVIGYVANTLILLGLIGTVVGFVIAVGGLGDSIAQGEDVERVKGVLGQIVNGMGIALFTTLVGSILGGIWLQLHYQLLLRAVANLVVHIVERADIEIIPALANGGDPAPNAPSR